MSRFLEKALDIRDLEIQFGLNNLLEKNEFSNRGDKNNNDNNNNNNNNNDNNNNNNDNKIIIGKGIIFFSTSVTFTAF